MFAITIAEELNFNVNTIATIAPEVNEHQCLLVIDINLPDSTDLDTLALISIAKLIVQVDYELPDSLPMALGCAPVISGFNRENLSLEALKSSPESFVDCTKISKTTLSLHSNGTAKFNITQTLQWMILNSIDQITILVYPLEGHSHFSGVVGTPAISVSYFRREPIAQ